MLEVNRMIPRLRHVPDLARLEHHVLDSEQLAHCRHQDNRGQFAAVVGKRAIPINLKISRLFGSATTGHMPNVVRC